MRTRAVPTRDVRRRGGGAVALAVLGVAAAVVSVTVQLANGNRPLNIALTATAGSAFVAAGLVARDRRPANRTGALMLLVGFGLFAEDIQLSTVPLLFTLGLLLTSLSTPLLVWLVLAFPTGRLGGIPNRVLVGVAWLLFVIEAALVPTFDVAYYRPAGSNLLFVRTAPELRRVVNDFIQLGGAVAATGVLTVLLLRLRRTTPAGRRIIGPVYVTAMVCGAASIFASIGDQLSESHLPYRLGVTVYGIAFALLPLTFLVGLLRLRLHKSPASELLATIADPAPAEDLQRALRSALGDPTVELITTDTEPSAALGRAVTPLRHGSDVVGWLVHDAALAEDAYVLRAVASATALALVNQRLAARSGEQYAELRAAARRLAEVADLTRRQVERDLHDGAQQQIVTALLQLRLASDDTGAPAELIDAAALSLEGALSDLRALARGLHPAILSDAGLAEALRALAERSPVPVSVTCADLELTGPAESAYYFAAAEALTNVAKHADAGRVWLTLERHADGSRLIVADDGRGGAHVDPAGTGLAGLRDRFRVLGGELTVDSRAGGGTDLRAWLP